MSKCWNIIKVIAGIDVFIPVYLNSIEKELLPLFEYLQFPEKIEFDDEILTVVSIFLKKAKKITPAM